MNADQLAKLWIKTHPKTNQETIYEAERAGFELLEVNGTPALVHRADHALIEDAVAGIAPAPANGPDVADLRATIARLQAEIDFAPAPEPDTKLQQERDALQAKLEQAEQEAAKARRETELAKVGAVAAAKDCPPAPPALANAVAIAVATLQAAMEAAGTAAGQGTAGQRAYEARQHGQRWADLPRNAQHLARAYARSRALPWPPEPAK